MATLTHAAHQRHQVSSVLRLAPKRGIHRGSQLLRVPGRAVAQVGRCHVDERRRKSSHKLRFACLPVCLTDWLTEQPVGSSDSLFHPERVQSGFLWVFSWFGVFIFSSSQQHSQIGVSVSNFLSQDLLPKLRALCCHFHWQHMSLIYIKQNAHAQI